MIYDLIKNYSVPIKWVISATKLKDGIDFTYAAKDYKGGPFIIPAEYRNATINARIAYWQTQGTIGTTTTTALTVPVTDTIRAVSTWTVNSANSAIAIADCGECSRYALFGYRFDGDIYVARALQCGRLYDAMVGGLRWYFYAQRNATNRHLYTPLSIGTKINLNKVNI